MNNEPLFDALCWGGPLDGERFAATTPVIRDIGGAEYRYERVAVRDADTICGAWIRPGDQAARERILLGVRAAIAAAQLRWR